jgi:putative transposase
MVAMRESAELAKRLIEESCRKQCIQPGQLTLHADRGISMSSRPVAFLLAGLGVTKTHSRPHVSNDNPYSESQFRTLKYVRSSRIASAAFRTVVLSARDFFAGTTANTATRVSAYSRWSTTTRPTEFSNSANKYSVPPINFIRNASCGTLRAKRSKTSRRPH